MKTTHAVLRKSNGNFYKSNKYNLTVLLYASKHAGRGFILILFESPSVKRKSILGIVRI